MSELQHWRRILFFGATFLAGGCVQGPDPQSPVAALPAEIRGVEPGAGNSFDDSPWRRLFRDSEVPRLIERALVRNPDLRSAEASIQVSRANAGWAAAAGSPQLDAGLGGQVLRLGIEENPTGAFGDRNRSPMGGSFQASWEIDWWGRIRRSREAALADLMAVSANREALRTQVVAMVAGCYLELLLLEEQLWICAEMKQNADAHEKWLSVNAALAEDNEGERLNLRERSIRVRLLESDLRERILLKENELRQWCGDFPGVVVRSGNLHQIQRSLHVAPSIPADAVLRRPDVVAAGWRHQSAMARIGESKALTLPQFQITGRSGLLSSSLRGLLESGASGYAIGPSIAWNLIDGGQGKAAHHAAIAEAERTRADFDAAVLGAFREVADGIIRFQRLREREENLEDLVTTMDRKVNHALARAEGGEGDSGAVLWESWNRLLAKLELSRARGERMATVVEVYRLLGGAWR